MDRIVHVNDGFNAFTIQLGGKLSYTSIFGCNGKLLRKSLVNQPYFLTHLCEAGEYAVETDGEIVDIIFDKIVLKPLIFDVKPDNLDRVLAETNWVGTKGESEKLHHLSEHLLEYYSTHSFQLRKGLIPEYKLQNAVLGIYDKKTLDSYRATIKAFRTEYYRLEKAIKAAKTLTALKKVKAKFPQEIISGQ